MWRLTRSSGRWLFAALRFEFHGEPFLRFSVPITQLAALLTLFSVSLHPHRSTCPNPGADMLPARLSSPGVFSHHETANPDGVGALVAV